MPDHVHTAFNDIVLDGILEFGGMAGFEDVLSLAETKAIHAYLEVAQLEASIAAANGELAETKIAPRATRH